MALFLLFDGIDELRVLATNFMGDVAGYLVSIDLSGFSPLLLLASLLVLGMVSVYHALSN